MQVKNFFWIVVLLWLGQRAPSISAKEGSKKVYKHGLDGYPQSLDPVHGGSIYSTLLVTSIYETLYSYQYLARPFALLPNLADGYPLLSKDGLTLTFSLKKGSYFQDAPCFAQGKGREVTAADFVYSLKRHFDPKNRSTGAWLWNHKILGLDEWQARGARYQDSVPGLLALDRYTLQIRLVKPFPKFLYTLALSFAAVVPHEAVAYYGKEFGCHPVGSGPYKLTEFNRQKAVLKKNSNYRPDFFHLEEQGYDAALHAASGVASLEGKRLPLLDDIEVHFMDQATSRWSAFNKKDELHYSLVPLKFLPQVVASSVPFGLKDPYAQKYNYLPLKALGFHYIEFNMSLPEIGYHPDPKQNKRNWALRCALRKAFDWRKKIGEHDFGMGEAFAGVIPPGIDGFDPNLSKESITVDIVGAKKLLRDYGWTAKNLPLLEYASVANVRSRQDFELLRSWVAQIGFPGDKLVLKTFPSFGEYFTALKKGQVQIHGDLIWYLDYPDAENVLQVFYGPNRAPGSNTAQYANPEFDRLFAKGIDLPESLERTAAFQEANRLLIEDCAVISGYSAGFLHMWHKNVVMYPNQGGVGSILKFIDMN